MGTGSEAGEQLEAGRRPCLGGWKVLLSVSGLESWTGALDAQVHVPTHPHSWRGMKGDAQ